DASGKISAISEGSAVITAESVVNPNIKATSQATVHPSTPIHKYIVASDDAILSDEKKTVQLRIDGEMEGGGTLTNPPYYKVAYQTDHPNAVVDPITGKLTFTGDLAGVKEIAVTADIQEYKDLIYSESFENGWGEFVTEQNPPTSATGGKISDKVAYHGKYGVL